eukprot:1611807-Amphidinium_carterae.1
MHRSQNLTFVKRPSLAKITSAVSASTVVIRDDLANSYSNKSATAELRTTQNPHNNNQGSNSMTQMVTARTHMKAPSLGAVASVRQTA